MSSKRASRASTRESRSLTGTLRAIDEVPPSCSGTEQRGAMRSIREANPDLWGGDDDGHARDIFLGGGGTAEGADGAAGLRAPAESLESQRVARGRALRQGYLRRRARGRALAALRDAPRRRHCLENVFKGLPRRDHGQGPRRGPHDARRRRGLQRKPHGPRGHDALEHQVFKRGKREDKNKQTYAPSRASRQLRTTPPGRGASSRTGPLP